MADQDWLWNKPLGIPEAEDIGPPLGDREIGEWEARHGVPLPAILRRAYRQLDGGYIRGSSDRGVAFLRLHQVEPVQPEYMDDSYWSGQGAQFDAARLFDLGWDDTGAHILLYYAEPGIAEPVVYAHYTDGGSIERLAETADGLFASAPDRRAR
jgi:hypothetical protein